MVWAFVRLSRPHFLLGGALLFGLGAASTGRIDPVGYALGQLMVSSAQITAHYVNEYADREADRAVAHRTFFSGGSGVLVSGLLGERTALRAGLVSTGVALLAAAALAVTRPWSAVLGLAALGISWAYSMPPVRLLGTGWGEAATSGVVAGVVPLVGTLSQGAVPDARLWWAIAILLPVHQAMLLTFELPDLATDADAGKRVLGVRLGRRRTVALASGLLAAAALVAVVGVSRGRPLGGAALGLVPAAVTAWALRGERHTLLTWSAVATLVLTAGGLLAGFLG